VKLAGQFPVVLHGWGVLASQPDFIDFTLSLLLDLHKQINLMLLRFTLQSKLFLSFFNLTILLSEFEVECGKLVVQLVLLRFKCLGVELPLIPSLLNCCLGCCDRTNQRGVALMAFIKPLFQDWKVLELATLAVFSPQNYQLPLHLGNLNLWLALLVKG
jgi:hypothetical protein